MNFAAYYLVMLLAAQACPEAIEMSKPCVGLLIPMEEAALCLQCRDVQLPRANASLVKCQETADANFKYWSKLNRASEARATKLRAAYDEVLGLTVPTHREPWFGWLGGATLAGGVALFASNYDHEGLRWTSLGIAGVGAGLAATYLVIELLD